MLSVVHDSRRNVVIELMAVKRNGSIADMGADSKSVYFALESVDRRRILRDMKPTSLL
jgi:hypothetical protein